MSITFLLDTIYRLKNCRCPPFNRVIISWRSCYLLWLPQICCWFQSQWNVNDISQEEKATMLCMTRNHYITSTTKLETCWFQSQWNVNDISQKEKTTMLCMTRNHYIISTTKLETCWFQSQWNVNDISQEEKTTMLCMTRNHYITSITKLEKMTFTLQGKHFSYLLLEHFCSFSTFF